jgi:hypothetical protein
MKMISIEANTNQFCANLEITQKKNQWGPEHENLPKWHSITIRMKVSVLKLYVRMVGYANWEVDILNLYVYWYNNGLGHVNM